MLSERLERQKQNIFNKEAGMVFYERIQYLIESRELYQEEPYAVCYGKTLKYILNHMTIVVGEEENIAGKVPEILPSEEQVQQAYELSDIWWGDKTPKERQPDCLFYYSYNWVKRRAPWFMSMGHLGFDWGKIIRKGFGELKAYAGKYKEKYEKAGKTDQVFFLKGVIECYEAFQDYIRRYERALKRAADKEENVNRKKQLYHMGEICGNIAEKPAATMEEAVQLIWFLILILQKVCGCGVLDLGRMDQYLLEFYKRDLENKNITETAALELIEEFYLKNNEIMANCDHMSTEDEAVDNQIEVAFDDPNYLIIGGLLERGRTGVNELSYLFVEAAYQLRLKNPFVIVRYHKEISRDFMERVCDAIRNNASMVIYNDDTMLPALQKYGIQEEDAYGYGLFGCNDPNLLEKEGGLRQLWLNLPKALELALNDGDFPMQPKAENPENQGFDTEDMLTGIMTGAYYGAETGDPCEFRSMDEVLHAVELQIYELLHQYRQALEKNLEKERIWNRGKLRIEDCFLDGTIENAVDWNSGGTKYHKIVMQGCGLATVADSLAAIDYMVFQKKKITMKEFCTALKKNYEGYEELQKELKELPWKYGNDIDEADRYAAWTAKVMCQGCVRENREEYLYQLFPTISTDRGFTEMGRYVGATADGRKAKEPISENQSPVTGKDTNGILALLNSAAKLPYNEITGGPLNLRLHPSSVKGEKGLQMFQNVLRTYLDMGGMQVQMNIVSRQELLQAQKYPEQYKSLCVRVTGYSAYFVQMNKKAQDELIMRTEM